MDNIKSLEREVELLKEILELKTKLLEYERGFTYQKPIPYYPQPYTWPAYPRVPYYSQDAYCSGGTGAIGYA
jgi:hypothetical protein